MPVYEYLCPACQERFEIRASVEDYASGLKTSCPRCGGERVVRVFSPLAVVSSKGGEAPKASCCGGSCGCT